MTKEQVQAVLFVAMETAVAGTKRRRNMSEGDYENVLNATLMCLNIDLSEFSREFLKAAVDAEVMALGILASGKPWWPKALGFVPPNPVPGSFAADWQKQYGAEAPYDVMLEYFQCIDELADKCVVQETAGDE